MSTLRTPGHYYVVLPTPGACADLWVLHTNHIWYAPEALTDPSCRFLEVDRGLTWQDRWPDGTTFLPAK